MSKRWRILAIETSGRQGSAALGTEDRLLATGSLSGDMRHAAELMPTIDRLTKEVGWTADSLTDVFISIGPGSFTGLRIAVTIARTLAWSVGARIVAVPTVDVLARNALLADPLPENVAVVLDAKRAQVYAGAFHIEGRTCGKVIDACLADPAEFLARCGQPLHVLGEGVAYHGPAIVSAGAHPLDPSLWPGRAEHVWAVGLEMATAGRYASGPDLLPLYIRRPEAEEKWEKLHPPSA